MPNLPSAGYQPPHSQELHDRAHASATELRGHVVTMATGVLAVFYFRLTRGPDVQLPFVPVLLSVGVVVAMAGAVFAGLWAAFADGRWSYMWAKFIERESMDEAGEAPVPGSRLERVPAAVWRAKRDWWHVQKWRWEHASLGLFAAGVLLTAVYLVVRLAGVA